MKSFPFILSAAAAGVAIYVVWFRKPASPVIPISTAIPPASSAAPLPTSAGSTPWQNFLAGATTDFSDYATDY